MGGQGRRGRPHLTAPTPREGNARPAAIAFAVGLALAFALLMRAGPRQWFFLDEWDFLSGRTAWDVSDLLEPHNGHWSTLPILLYRGMYRTFGLLSYVPYRAMSVGSHLVAAALMRVLLRRLGVGPWLANAVLLPWVLFGSGWQNIVWAFQVAWNACLIAALGQLLLADHDGPPDRRDALGVGLGIAGVMCAGIYVPLLGAVGLGLLLKRGWRPALLQAGPVLALYATWSVAYGGDNGLEPLPDGRKADFVWTGVSSAVGAFSWVDGVAILLSVGCVAALIAWARRAPAGARVSQLAIPCGLAAGAIAYMYVVASGRTSFGIDMARSSRYLHVVTFLLLPLLAMAAAEVARRIAGLEGRRRVLASGAALGLLWFGIPGNLTELVARDEVRLVLSGNPSSIESMAKEVVDRPDLPGEANPFGYSTPRLTIAWMRQAVADGHLRALPPGGPYTAASVDKSLMLVQIDEPLPDGSRCAPVAVGDGLELTAGQRLTFDGEKVDGHVTTADGIEYDRELLLSVGRTILAIVDLRLDVTFVEDAALCS